MSILMSIIVTTICLLILWLIYAIDSLVNWDTRRREHIAHIRVFNPTPVVPKIQPIAKAPIPLPPPIPKLACIPAGGDLIIPERIVEADFLEADLPAATPSDPAHEEVVNEHER